MPGEQPPPHENPWSNPGAQPPPATPYAAPPPASLYAAPPPASPYAAPPGVWPQPAAPPPGVWSQPPSPQGWGPAHPWYGGAQWPPRRQWRAPRKAWYILPAVLTVLAVTALAVFFATRSDELGVANQPERKGTTTGGVSVLARPGWHYDIYLPDSQDQPTVTECAFHTQAPVNAAVAVDHSTEGSDWFTDDEDHDWYQVGSIVAPQGVSGRVLVTCTGFDGPMDVYADDSMFGWMMLVVLLSGFGLLAAITALIVLLVVRSKARRQQAVPATGYGWPS